MPVSGLSGSVTACMALGISDEVMAQIARCGEEGWLAVLVAAIAGDHAGRGEGLVETIMVVRIEFELEQPQIVGAVLVFAEARADNDACDMGVLENPAGGDVGDRDRHACGRSRRQPSRMPW